MVATLLVPGAAGAERYDVPLAVQTHGDGVEPETCGYRVGLALATGYDVRAPEEEERAWMAVIIREESQLVVELKRPDGTLTASKRVEAEVPCVAALEILTILLAAHVPGFLLETAATETPPEPEPEPEPEPPPPREPVTPYVDEVLPPLAVAEPPPPVRQRVRIVAIPSLVLAGAEVRYLAGLWGSFVYARLHAGLHLFGAYQRRQLDRGRMTISTGGARLWLGYLLHHAPRLEIQAGVLGGGRFTQGATRGLLENDAAIIGSGDVGGFFEGTWLTDAGPCIAVGVALVSLLPRPAFEVAELGRVYETPAALVELYFGLGWGAAL